MLCLYQVQVLRSAVAIVVCAAEWYVVWLSASLTQKPRDDGFLDSADAASAGQSLNRHLGLLMDLTWLEEA